MQSLAMTPPLEVSVVSYYTTNIEIKTSGIRMVAIYRVCVRACVCSCACVCHAIFSIVAKQSDLFGVRASLLEMIT